MPDGLLFWLSDSNDSQAIFTLPGRMDNDAYGFTKIAEESLAMQRP